MGEDVFGGARQDMAKPSGPIPACVFASLQRGFFCC